MVTIHPCVQVSSKVEDSRFQCEKYVPEKSSRVEDDADFETWPSTYFVSSWNQCKKTYKRRPLLLFCKVCNDLVKARNMSVKLQKRSLHILYSYILWKNPKLEKVKKKNIRKKSLVWEHLVFLIDDVDSSQKMFRDKQFFSYCCSCCWCSCWGRRGAFWFAEPRQTHHCSQFGIWRDQSEGRRIAATADWRGWEPGRKWGNTPRR